MEFFLQNNRDFYVKHLAEKLSTIYEVDSDQAKLLLTNSDKKMDDHETIQERKPPECIARTWNKGYGAKCCKPAKDGSEFCSVHGMMKHLKLCKTCSRIKSKGQKECVNVYHKYVWECLGRYDEPKPKHLFIKCLD